MIQRIMQGAVEVIICDDSLNADHLGALTKTLDECFEEGQPRIVLDLKSSPLIDSAGLELLVDMHERCQQRGGSIKLAGLNPLCLEIVRITGVSKQLELYDDARSAVRSFL